jgi:pyruvate/2-oxoglutarate dehydrogenase complex dihydrolipoamide acyltransferase (E2) component
MSTTHRTTHDDPAQRANGYLAKHVDGPAAPSAASTTASAEDATPAGGSPTRPRARAASDGAHGTPVAPAPGPPAASTPRDLSADAARDSNIDEAEGAARKNRTGRAKRNASSKPKDSGSKNDKADPIPPALGVLPADAFKFTEALNAKADFLEVGKRLLNSDDERIVKGVWEYMLELRYGKEAPVDENSRRIVIDMPRPLLGDLPTQ